LLSTYQGAFSQEVLVSPLREKEGYYSPSKSLTYRRSRTLEQTGFMIGQQMDNDIKLTKQEQAAAWKEQLSKDIEVKHSQVMVPRKPVERRPFTPWLYGKDDVRTIGNSGLTEDEFLARGAEVRERLRRDRSDVSLALASKVADMTLIQRRHKIQNPGGAASEDVYEERWI
jgi:hypothetical protein